MAVVLPPLPGFSPAIEGVEPEAQRRWALLKGGKRGCGFEAIEGYDVIGSRITVRIVFAASGFGIKRVNVERHEQVSDDCEGRWELN